jgi:succinate-semialdehyde dehydrogenase/glutarate-semialdehyde dehydrogenase
MTATESPSTLRGMAPQRSQALIGARWTATGRTFAVAESTTGAPVADVADCGEREAREAIEAGVAALAEWSRQTAFERGAVLRKWHDLIVAHEADLGTLMAREMGKPVTEARGEVKYAAGFVEFYAGEATRVYGQTIPSQSAGKRLFVRHKPVGLVYAITPWNFPAAMVTRKVAPALAAGCTVMLKPAEETPLTALRLADLWLEAGGPGGTLQVLPCLDPVPVSRVMFADTRVRKLTFTGSTEVGMRLYAQAAATVKRVSLELGGHAPFIVCEDAEVDQAVAQVAASKFRNAGQTCVCANRVYVHEAVYDRFVARFAEVVEGLRVGDPLDPATQIGPLVNEAAAAKVSHHVDDAVAKGATVIRGGTRGTGTYYAPTILSNVRAGMRILEEETFGPVAPVIRFRDEAEVIRLANGVPVGLAAYVWTRDLARAFRLSEALEYGIVGVNDGLPATPQAPFGGVKHSGIGREGGHWGLEEFLDVQYVSMLLPPA